MPPRRISLSSPAWMAFQAAVIIGLGAGFGNLATWSASTGMPFLTNLPALAGSPAFTLPAAAEILHDISTITVLEAADGNWATAMSHMPAARCVADLTDAFNAHLWPARSQASTRSKHQSNWAVVVT